MLNICPSRTSNLVPTRLNSASLVDSQVLQDTLAEPSLSLFATVLTTVQSSWASVHVIAATEAAGASRATAEAVLEAFPLGEAALMKVQSLTTAIATSAGAAFVQSYVEGVR